LRTKQEIYKLATSLDFPYVLIQRLFLTDPSVLFPLTSLYISILWTIIFVILIQTLINLFLLTLVSVILIHTLINLFLLTIVFVILIQTLIKLFLLTLVFIILIQTLKPHSPKPFQLFVTHTMGQRISSCIAPCFACSNSVYANYGDNQKLKSQPNDSFNLQMHPQDCEKLKSQEKDSFYLQIHQELHFPCKLNFLKQNSNFFLLFCFWVLF